MTDFRLPLRDWIEAAVDWLQVNLGGFFDGFADTVDAVINFLMSVLTALPPLVVLGIMVVLVLVIAGWRLALFALGGLLIIHNINLWSPFIETLALVVSAQLLILVVG